MSVSVLIVSRNRPRFFEFVISQLSEKFNADDELVLVLDGSDSDYGSTLGQIAGRVKVKTIRLSPAVGLIEARNIGIKGASHEVILQLDDDSWPVESNALRQCEVVLEQESDAGAIAVPIFQHWSQGEGEVGTIYGRWRNEKERSSTWAFEGCGAVLRRSAVLEAGLYPGYYQYGNEEVALTLRLFAKGWLVRFRSAFRVVHGHEQLSRESAYLKTRTEDPRARIAANQLCMYEEMFPRLLAWPLQMIVLVVALRRGVETSYVLDFYRRSRSSLRSELKLDAFVALRYLAMRGGLRLGKPTG